MYIIAFYISILQKQFVKIIRREGKGILVVGIGFIYPGQRLYISCLAVFVWLSFDIINAKKDDHCINRHIVFITDYKW
jgi:hypothetical protein